MTVDPADDFAASELAAAKAHLPNAQRGAAVESPSEPVGEGLVTSKVSPVGPTEVLASPAPLLRTVGAWLVDVGVLAVLAGVYLLVAISLSKAQPPASVTGLEALVFKLKGASALLVPGIGLTVLLAFVYTTAFAFLARGRTLGRRLFGLHLVDDTGRAPGPGRALLRAGFALLSFMLFLSGFWLALFDRKGQALHDKLASTFVVRLTGA